MSRSVARLKSLVKVAEKIDHSSPLRTNIPAGMASAGPPLGSMLGQRSINIAAFCKDFNERTAEIKKGIPLPTRVKVNADRSYEITIHQPPTSWLLKQAAGIQRGTMLPGREIAGKITLKHVYEIAMMKLKDPSNEHFEVEHFCKLVISTARSCGIEVVDKLDPVEYGKFLEERRIIVEEQKKALLEIREAKMLRMA